MRRAILTVAFLAGLLAACAPNVPPRPSDIDNACAIVAERPGWLKAMQATQAKWGVPIPNQLAFIYQESKFAGDARTPLSFKLGVIPMGRASSAFGYAQAIDSTWNWYKRDTGNRSARRDRFEDAVDFMGWYMNVTKERLGIGLGNVRLQYLAYHEGHSGFRRKSYRHKPWLVRFARATETRAKTYKRQLKICGVLGGEARSLRPRPRRPAGS